MKTKSCVNCQFIICINYGYQRLSCDNYIEVKSKTRKVKL